MLRYVVLRHEINPDSTNISGGASHWDLMLQDEGKLLTWAIERLPNLSKSDELNAIPCKQLARHRIEYLDYEGPISGDRGTVTRWDCGTFQWKSRTTNELVAILSGEKLRGTITLAKAADLETQPTWICTYQPEL